MQIKILSWNIWINGYFDKVALFVKDSEADIICLQEVKDDDPERDIIDYLDNLGYDHAFASTLQTWGGKKYKHGPAVFSKYAIKHSRTYMLSEENTRVVVRADIDINTQTLHVFSTHLIHTHQQPSAIQDEQVENLAKLISKEKSILMGDFNALPDSNAIKIMDKILVNTDENLLPTWSIYPEGCRTCNPKAELIYKLDYIFASKDLKTRDYKVEKSQGSDHLPISILVEL